MNTNWNGAVDPWVWVPYDCYYHIYSADDILYCAEKKNISWFLVLGGTISLIFAQL